MKRHTFDAIVGFLQGVFWAFLLIGAWTTFQIVSLFGTGLAIFSTLLYIFLMLLALLLLETMRVYRLQSDESAKQTQLLTEIRDLLRREP